MDQFIQLQFEMQENLFESGYLGVCLKWGVSLDVEMWEMWIQNIAGQIVCPQDTDLQRYVPSSLVIAQTYLGPWMSPSLSYLPAQIKRGEFGLLLMVQYARNDWCVL